MPLAEAAALAGARRLRVEPHDPASDRGALERLAQWCERFSPVVGVEEVEEPGRPEAIFLEIHAVARFFGGEAALAGQLLRALERRGLAACVAVADAPGAAWAVASASPVLDAKASLSDRLIVIPSGPAATAAALGPLPIAALRLPETTLRLLGELGLDRIDQLESLSRGALAARLGTDLLRRLDQALGRADEVIPARRPRADWTVRQELDYPTARRDVLAPLLEDLAGRLARALLRHDRGALRLVCRLAIEGRSDRPVCLDVGLFEPTASARRLVDLLSLQWDRLALAGPVAEIHLEATVTAPLEYRQRSLFSEEGLRSERAWAELVERLSGRLGRDAVLRAWPVRDAQPELAYRYQPMLAHSTRRGPSRRDPVVDFPSRPCRLLRRPVPLAPPVDVADSPAWPGRFAFTFEGHAHRIVRSWGPERIETGWWRGAAVRRDYYRAETASGHHFWVFRRLRDGRWFLHGVFE